MKDHYQIIQITDTHLFKSTHSELLGVKSYESFKQVLELIRKEEKGIDLILLTGDLSQDGSIESYEMLDDLLSTFGVPALCVPGNHDNLENLQRVYPRKVISYDKNLLSGNWQFILLNSQIPNEVRGELNKEELLILEDSLKKYSNYHSLIIFHHPPVLTNTKWLDEICLSNKKIFWDLIKKYNNGKGVVFGHAHQQIDQTYQNIKCFGTPSTCIQFKPNVPYFVLDEKTPGYRWFELHKDGEIKSVVKRLEKYVGHFDASAKGY